MFMIFCQLLLKCSAIYLIYLIVVIYQEKSSYGYGYGYGYESRFGNLRNIYVEKYFLKCFYKKENYLKTTLSNLIV